ncbi:hypothetical protein C0Q70_19129 [Pomacea canaliculata]|uniref:Small monomeric GTPase n=2 Tax=Pomacea canaliculata TaxID=400727 RepID=A0A2T7NII2_POMCA|nr:hypothetical protein C0Q70_19129 [Pomacea canaliculata]
MPQAERYLNVSPVREVYSAPHSRSCSFKTYRRPQDLDLWDSRPRNQLSAHLSESHSSETRFRQFSQRPSFKLTSKGLVNHGDSFKRRSTHSLMSSGSAATEQSEQRLRTLSVASEESGGVSGTGSCCAPSYFRVALLGAAGVGKSALIRQFMTSEYKGTFDIATPDAEDPETTVSVLLDGEESMIEFVDEPNENELDNVRADAFAVVFSLADVASYTTAISIVRHLRVDLCSDRAIVLVGNKVDLARQRRVSSRDARLIAMKYDCKYEETSAALNHRVDELLVGILSQIRLKLAPPSSDTLLAPEVPSSKGRSQSPRRAMSFLTKLFNQTKKKAKSCDNLLIH